MPTGRIKEKYRPKANKREREYHQHLIESCMCVCCGRQATVVHHPLREHPDQRWRRDHEYVVPMNGECHTILHTKFGSELLWRDDLDLPAMAHAFRASAYEAGLL